MVRCVHFMYGWRRRRRQQQIEKKIYFISGEKQRNLVALLLLAALLTICYYENPNIDCAINTRPFTSFQLHDSAFLWVNAHTKELERQSKRGKRTHTHMTISKFASTLTVKACSYYSFVTKIWCTVSQFNGIEVKAS